MTTRLYLEDATLRESSATVLTAGPECIILDRSVFYPRAGGQPGDSGTLLWPSGAIAITEACKGEADTILHLPGLTASAVSLPAAGTQVQAILDWPRRLAHMRMHTALHLLCALLPGVAVTGGQIGADRSRLDVDLPQSPDKDTLDQGFATLIEADHPISAEWVDESVLDTNPGLVRTLSVQPPRGTGRLRLVRIGASGRTHDDRPIDLQPCGGTHVAHTALVGRVRVAKIENKGRQNRRITLVLED